MDVKFEPITIQPSTTATFGALGVSEPKESFDVNKIHGKEKVTKPNESRKLYKLGGLTTQYYNPLERGINGAHVSAPKNPSLSFIPGQLGINLPLGEDALYTTGGRIAANLNIIT